MSQESFLSGDQTAEHKQETQESQGTSFGADAQSDNSGAEKDGVKTSNNFDLDAILKRNEHAQTHIKTLESENEEYRKKLSEYEQRLEEARKVEDVLERLSSQENDGVEYNVDDIVNKVTQSVTSQLTEREMAEKQSKNWDTVTSTLTDKYGDKVDDHVKKVCEENEMTIEEMVHLSKTKPKVALKLCGVEESQPRRIPSEGINTQAFEKIYGQDQDTTERLTSKYVNMNDSDRVKIMTSKMEQKLQELSG